ncbi:RNA-directed DNA polymerase, eukaryota [Tanacetum coccineum]
MLEKVEGTSLVNVRDRWVWSLEGSEEFSVGSVRRLIDDYMLLEVTSKTRWMKAVPIKVNVLAWKVKLDCLPTRLNISRREILRKISRWWDVTYTEGTDTPYLLDGYDVLSFHHRTRRNPSPPPPSSPESEQPRLPVTVDIQKMMVEDLGIEAKESAVREVAKLLPLPELLLSISSIKQDYIARQQVVILRALLIEFVLN